MQTNATHQDSKLNIATGTTIEILKKLVSVNSVNPDIGHGPGEAQITQEIAALLEKEGIEVRTQKVQGDRSNVIGVIHGEGGGKSLMLSGHMDTVGVEDMKISPFDPVVKNGKLYGRGSCDMKGGLAGALSATIAIARSGIRLLGDLYVSGVVDEEYVSTGTEKLVEQYKTDGAIVGEPTRMGVGVAHMGYMWIDVETKGTTAHGSIPEKGHDAIVDMARVIDQIELYKGDLRRKKHSLLGSPKIHTSTIEGGRSWSVVPDTCHLRIERRTLPSEKTSNIMKELERVIAKARSKTYQIKSKTSLNFERSAFEVSTKTNLSKSLYTGLGSVTKKPTFVGVTYWSDASIFLYKGKMDTCLFGPGDIGFAHSPVEYIPTKELEESAHVYARTAMAFCGTR